MGYLLSIVVPTKDRYYYLENLIELVKSFDSQEIELIVHDNTADNSEILRFMENLNYPHLKYFHKQEQISVKENCDRGILNSTGEYVCLIGDDDGVTRHIVECVKWMKRNDFSILKSSLTIYKWPSFRCQKDYDVSSTVLFNSCKYYYKIVNCKESLEKLLSSGIDTLIYMPKVYNGIVKRSLLDKVYSICGTYSPGPSPDMANAVALALIEDFYVYVDYPIIIGGHSSHLGGDAGRYKNGIGPLEEQPFISKEYINGWSKEIPKVWASRTVWPESAITALKAFKATEYLEKINFNVLYKKFIESHPDYSHLLNLSNSEIKRIKFIAKIRKFFRHFLSIKYRYLFKHEHIYDHLHYYKGYSDISEAEYMIANSVDSFSNVFK